jgi:catechol 2,3-dioxygenase
VSIAPETHPGAVRLTVGDLQGQASFYEETIGLTRLGEGDGLVRLGAGADGMALVELRDDAQASPRPPRTSGLFHLAILLPDRTELGRALQRIAGAGWGLTGAADHLVSEALYLDDPEGNGIEIYRDRPREEWQYVDGELQMATLPLDLPAIAAEAPVEEHPGPMPGDTAMGHVHLNVSEIPASRAFYEGALGFDVSVDSYLGALFVSAGGYHHHIGLNIWNGEGAPPPPPGSRGLERFHLVVPDRAEIDAVAGRLREAGYEAEERDGELLTVDPSGNRIALTTA